MNDFNKDIKNIIKNFSVKFQNNDKSLLDSLHDVKFCIIGNNSTSFLETYASDIPTILFWTKKTFLARNKVMQFFQTAKKNKLYFDKSEILANYINTSYQIVDQNWNSRKNFYIKKLIKKNFSNLDKSKISKLLNLLK